MNLMITKYDGPATFLMTVFWVFFDYPFIFPFYFLLLLFTIDEYTYS